MQILKVRDFPQALVTRRYLFLPHVFPAPSDYHGVALYIPYSHTRTRAARHPIDIREANWDGTAGDHGPLYWHTLPGAGHHRPVDKHRREGGK